VRKINELQKLYIEAEKRFIASHLDFDRKNLYRTIDILYRKSKENYLKLSNPKTCSEALYADIWIWQEIGDKIARESVGKAFKLDNPPSEHKASAEFCKRYPSELIKKIKKNASCFDWKDMDEKFIAMVKERNKFSLSKGYVSRLDMYQKNDKIPKSEYKRFLEKIDEVIYKSNEKLSALLKAGDMTIDKHCFICELEPFPFKNIKELLALFEKKNPILHKNIGKINISLGEYSESKYVKESDSFKIILDKNIKINHQKMDLIHELAHVVSYLKSFKKGENILKNGRYFREKSAIEIEIKFLEKYFPDLFLAKIGNILYNLPQTLFEIELYQKPNRNQGEVYAKCLNRCYANLKQEINRDYLLNEDILYGNFLWLPYAVAYTNALSDFFIKGFNVG